MNRKTNENPTIHGKITISSNMDEKQKCYNGIEMTKKNEKTKNQKIAKATNSKKSICNKR